MPMLLVPAGGISLPVRLVILHKSWVDELAGGSACRPLLDLCTLNFSLAVLLDHWYLLCCTYAVHDAAPPSICCQY